MDKKTIELIEIKGLPTIQIKPANVKELYQIRWQVLRPNEVNTTNVHYDGDLSSNAIHLKAVLADNIIGCISALPQSLEMLCDYDMVYRIRALAVSETYRGKGIGSHLLDAITRLAEAHATALWLSGRTHHRTWYENHKFKVVGDVYNITGTGPHYNFIKIVSSC